MSSHSHPAGSIGNWNIGTFKARLRKHVGQSSLSVTGDVSASGDVYVLGSISGSNNLAIGGNIHASGTITCDTLNVNEINSTSETINTLEVVDKVILAASGTYPNNATGAGLQIGGHSTGSAGTDIAATFFYNSTKNSMDLSTTLSSSGDLYALGSISGSNNLALGGNLHISGTLNKAYTSGGGHVSSSGDVYVLGSISGSNNLAIGGNASITGSLSANFVSAMGHANAQTLSTLEVPANYNSVLYGPVTIDSNQTVTISTDSNVAIVDIADA